MSDSDGQFRLAPPTEVDGCASVLWVTHPEHEARAFALAPGRGLADVQNPIVLEDALGIGVRVLDAEEHPVPGATVRQRLELAPAARAEVGAEARAQAFELWREATTDADGLARLAPLAGKQVVDAVLGERRSRPWVGSAPDDVTLSLVACCTVLGRVEPEDPRAELTECRVEILCFAGGKNRLVDSLAVRGDGTFGPSATPVVAGDRYAFELLGGAVVAATVERPVPSAGERVEVQLQAKRGFRFPVRVLDEQRSPVRAAKVGWAWQAVPERWQWVVEATDEEGIAVCRAAPAGSLWVEVVRKGFITNKQNLELWADVSPPYPINLQRGGTLRGRVTADGQPVREFTIVHRRASMGGELVPFDVKDSKDGSYELEGVPVGEIVAFAFSESAPRTEDVHLQIRAEEPATQDFALDSGAVVRGRVVDALSGEPIAAAVAQLWVTSGRLRLRRWGETARADADGGFELAGAARHDSNGIEVEAQGFAPFVQVFRVSGSSTDLGTLPLVRPRVLLVQLELDAGDDATRYSAEIEGTQSVAPTPFPHDGLRRFEGLVPGSYFVSVTRGIEWGMSRWCPVRPHVPAVSRFEVHKLRDLTVEVVPTKDTPLPDGAVLRARSVPASGSGTTTWQFPIPVSRKIDVGAVAGPTVIFEVLTRDERTLGSLSVPDVGKVSGIVRVELGGAGHRLRVVDRRGDPVQGLSVSVGVRPGGWIRSASTDSNGMIELPAFPHDRVDVALEQVLKGCGVIADVDLSRDPAEIVFDPHCGLAVRVVDGDVPLPGIPVWVQGGQGLSASFESLTSDDGGLASRVGFLCQEFRIQVDHAGLWPAEGTARATDPATPATLQVRRRGSVVLQLRRHGAPVSGAALRVVSDEFATDVGDWVAASKATSIPAGMRTDADGKLRLDGLPRGSYRWSVTREDGTSAGGQFSVEPARRVDVDLQIP